MKPIPGGRLLPEHLALRCGWSGRAWSDYYRRRPSIVPRVRENVISSAEQNVLLILVLPWKPIKRFIKLIPSHNVPADLAGLFLEYSTKTRHDWITEWLKLPAALLKPPNRKLRVYKRLLLFLNFFSCFHMTLIHRNVQQNGCYFDDRLTSPARKIFSLVICP